MTHADVVAVADVDSEKRFDDSLVHLGSWIHSVILDDITGSASYWLKSLAIICFKCIADFCEFWPILAQISFSYLLSATTWIFQGFISNARGT